MVRRCIRNPDGCSLSKRQPVRKTEYTFFGAECRLRVRSAEVTADVNAVARFEAFDVRSYRFHDAGCIESWSVGERRLLREGSCADIRMDRVDACGFYRDKNLMRARLCIWNVFQLHDCRRAELVDANGFHRMV